MSNSEEYFDVNSLIPDIDNKESNELVLHKPIINITKCDENIPDLDNDFNVARKNLNEIMELGKDALAESIAIAKQSAAPFAWDSVNSLLKTLLDANNSTLMLHDRKEIIKKKVNDNIDNNNSENNIKATQNNQNNFFVGSVAEIQEIIKGKK